MLMKSTPPAELVKDASQPEKSKKNMPKIHFEKHTGMFPKLAEPSKNTGGMNRIKAAMPASITPRANFMKGPFPPSKNKKAIPDTPQNTSAGVLSYIAARFDPYQKAECFSRNLGRSSLLAQALILTTNSTVAVARDASAGSVKHQLLNMFPNLMVEYVRGIHASEFHTEKEVAERNGLLVLSESRQKEWLDNDGGHGKYNHTNHPLQLAAMATTIGHMRMWEMSTNVPNGKWSLLLENDANFSDLVRENPGIIPALLACGTKYGADMIWLDEFHCREHQSIASFFGGPVVDKKNVWAWSKCSQAYAITSKAARELLKEQFKFNADHMLNQPIRRGAFTGFCPVAGRGTVLVHHDDEARSEIENWKDFESRSGRREEAEIETVKSELVV
eukprot:TRINITY_DN16777_c0_g1_i1.p1 TRINITY_DN16777_c0_g1~~TRINITY_DN16777_c0_g1_i1.p1  ORF type:complete len:420 (-),score=62.55 TRINITY_DN16777_c0_g1_i1:15-1181(-)